MKGYDLIKGMGYIDEDLVEEALTEQKKGRVLSFPARYRWVAAAACVAIAVFAGWGMTRDAKSSDMSAPAAVPMLNDQKDVTYTVGMADESAEMEEFTVEEAAAEAEPAENEAPTPMPSAEASMAVSDAGPDALETLTMIESYAGAPAAASYVVPENGEAGYSEPLKAAMAENGGAVLYRVYVEVFKDGEMLAPDDPEVAELLDMLFRDYGIVTAMETVTANTADGNAGITQTWPTLHATYEQLQSFPADDDHGWMLWLYDERPE